MIALPQLLRPLSMRRLGRLTRLATLTVATAGLAACDLNPNTEAKSITIAPPEVTVPVNGRVQAVATAFDKKGASISGKKIKWSTDNPAIAQVTQDGSVIGVSVGITTFSATANGATGTAKVTVTPELATSVTVSPINPVLRVLDSRQFTATAKNAQGVIISGRPARWASSNTTVATVSNEGVVTAVTVGVATIQAEIDGQVASTTVQVTLVPILSCALAPQTQKITVSAQAQPVITLRDSAGRTTPLTGRSINYASSNEIVATVSSTGLVTARRAGTAVITATTGDNFSVTCTANVEAVDARVFRISIQQRSGSLRLGVPRTFTASLLDSLNQVITGRVVTFTTSTPNFVNVSAQGVALGLQLTNGPAARIIARIDTIADTLALAVTNVPVAVVRLTPTAPSVFQGSTQKFTATVEDSTGATVTDRVVEWSTSDPSRASIDQTGLVTANGTGQVTITAASEGIARSVTLTILQVPAAKIDAPATFTVTRGTTSPFTIQVRDANGVQLLGRSVSINVDSPNIANVSSTVQSGTQINVTGIAVGTTNITLRALNQNGQPEGAPATVSVTVTAPPTTP